MPKPRLASLSVLAPFVTALGLLAGCTATGGAGGGDASRIRITLQAYEHDQHFELASESHTDRVAYYSRLRQDAARKVARDEVMDALADELDDQGFADHSQEGRAPSRGGTLISWSFEIGRGERIDHWAIGNGSDVDERLAFHECRNVFVQIYNLTTSFQAIENPDGGHLFKRAGQAQQGGP